jgi:hypothetical protein
MVWLWVAYFVVVLVVSYSMMPKDQPDLPIGQIKAPTADEGRDIGVLFGTREITGPNVVWAGDFGTQAIKSKGGKK